MKAYELNKSEIIKNPYSRIVISNKCPFHYHTFFEFSICTVGKYNNYINGKCYPCERGSVLLLRPKDEHYFVAEKPHACRDVYIMPEVFKAICDSVDPTLFDSIVNAPEHVEFKISNFQLQLIENKLNYFNDIYDKNELSLNLKHRSVIIDLLDIWQESSALSQAEMPEWISLLVSQLGTERFLNKNIEEIIATTNYSHGYVCREFKKHMGKTLQDYLSELRFSYTISLLKDTSISVAQIGDRLGYCATSNFIIAFKNKMGITPAQWRKMKKQ